MKLLTKEELGGIDSTSKTIDKWDEFLKKAVWNLGFRQSLIDNMYPYEAGIPMKDGSTMPVDSKTGRVFYKMSWADKLCGVASPIRVNTSNTQGFSYPRQVAYLMLCIWKSDIETYRKFFPDAEQSDYDHLAELDIIDFYRDEAFLENWATFVDNTEWFVSSMAQGSSEPDSARVGLLNELFKTNIKELCDIPNITRNANIFVYCKMVEDVYDPFPKDAVATYYNQLFDGYDPKTKWVYNSEVYLQDYLVISLNPIDKLMCSTKQAFSSCMSIAKQDDTTGTSSAAAMGLPSIFATDAIYMVFMTPGKHKNMYWEKEQWELPGDQRDKEKAYKYLKMTCRALTYKARLSKSCRNHLNTRVKTVSAEAEALVNEFAPERPRLYVGRQYSAKGEDYIWEQYIEVLLAKQGVATSLGFADALMKMKESLPIGSIPRAGYSNIDNFNNISYLRTGALTDHKIITTDRYGFRRGIYYDNVSLSLRPGNSSPSKHEWLAIPVEEGGEHQIIAGNTRYGSHGILDWSMSSSTDMFKVMMGTMKYSQVNTNLRICDHCGEVLTAEECMNKTHAGNRYCSKCLEELKMTKCEGCGLYYSKEEADAHQLINIRKFLNPRNWQEFPEQLACKNQLKSAKSGGGKAICAHCGKIEEQSYYNALRNVTVFAEIEGEQYKVTLCGDCLRKAVMCDKCKRVLFLDTISDACLLLPHRRVVCPDCIDTIRLKQETRDKLKSVLHGAHIRDFESEPTDDTNIADDIGRAADAKGIDVGQSSTLIKDVEKQIVSYLKAHPDESFPVLKSSNPPLPEEPNTEVDDVEDLSVPF